MIGPETARRILEVATEYWTEAVQEGAFVTLASGKEIGHRIADFVDEKTTALLETQFETKREVTASGRPRPRSMGDLWLGDNGIFHPVNVKAGEAGKNGQPNMVSLTKLLEALLKRHIDSYYLLIVKMTMPGVPAAAELPAEDLDVSQIVPHVYFVDMLEHLEFITFDAGPGQAMLKEKQFYAAFGCGQVSAPMSVMEKVSHLAALMEDGDRRLIENRRRKMDRLRKDVENYMLQPTHEVDQAGVKLG